jgi:hypothetical protein
MIDAGFYGAGIYFTTFAKYSFPCVGGRRRRGEG